MIPVANKLDVGVFAGPTIFSVKQDTVTTATVTEPGPTVTAPLTTVSKTSVGFNIGVDLQYMIAKRWGVGGIARYSIGSTRSTARPRSSRSAASRSAAERGSRF